MAKPSARGQQQRRSQPITNRSHLKSKRAERTSYTEYEVDAWVQEAEEGRGDRRNVWGELHTSEEPQDSEWGNPSRVMSGDPTLNL